MTKPLIAEIKALLTYILNTDNKSLRKKTLEFVMELLSEIEMNWKLAEKALKEELKGNRKAADKLIEQILNDVEKEEYSEHEHP